MDVRESLMESDAPLVVLNSVELHPGYPVTFDQSVRDELNLKPDAVPAEIVLWLETYSGAHGLDENGRRRFSARGTNRPIGAREFTMHVQSTRLTSAVAPFFLVNQTTSGGSQITGKYIADDEGEFNASFLAMIHRSREKESEVSQLFFEAFGETLVYDGATGAQALRLGQAETSLLADGRFTDAYTAHMRGLRKLQDQGSGMQAYMAAITPLAMGSAQVHLYDEPETYLHPPQARALGRQMGRLAASRNLQILAVTHDRDFVVGLLESGADLSFVRVSREGTGNRLRHVATSQVRHIWESGVLRYSGALAGLFYQRVIVCESESDCRFYSAVLDGLVEDGTLARPEGEALFVGAGGKTGASKRVEALAMLHVNISVVVDFDILNDHPGVLRTLLRALGEDWTDEDVRDFNVLKQHITDNNLKGEVKTSGLSSIDDDDVRGRATALIGRLKSRGVFIVPVGQLESFDKSTTLEKEPWVDEVLEQGRHLTLEAARSFMTDVVSA